MYTGSLKLDEHDSGLCPGCGKKKTLIRRRRSASFYNLDAKHPDHPAAGDDTSRGHDGAVCTNRPCSLFTDLSLVPTWDRATA